MNKIFPHIIFILLLTGCKESPLQYHGRMNGIKFAWNNEFESGVIYIPDYNSLTKNELINFSNCMAYEFGLNSISINSKHQFDYALPSYNLFNTKPGKELLKLKYSIEDLNNKDHIVEMGLIFQSGWYINKVDEKIVISNNELNLSNCDLKPINLE